MIDSHKGRRRYLTHAVWAMIAIGLSLFMIFTMNKGHPPLIIFLPLLIILWISGHIFIWSVAWLVAKGRQDGNGAESEGKPWPFALILALFGTGALASMGVIQMIVTGYLGRLYPYRYTSLWATMLSIKAIHAMCFVGLLSRKQWSRYATALLAAGWAILLAFQIAEHLPPRAHLNITELIIAFGIMVFLVILGLKVFLSKKVRAFLNN